MSDYIASELDPDDKNSWSTDPQVYRAMFNEFYFKLDAAASEENALCELYLTKEDDSLSVNWHDLILENWGGNAKKNGMDKSTLRQRVYKELYG